MRIFKNFVAGAWVEPSGGEYFDNVNPADTCDVIGRFPLSTRDDVDCAVEATSIGSLVECRTFEEFKDAAERAFLLAKLRESDWNVSETARLLDMPRSNLYKKIERYALTRENGQEAR